MKKKTAGRARTSRKSKARGRGPAVKGRTAGSGGRERISPRGDTRYVRRDAAGQFGETDDAAKSLRADRRTRARTPVKSGFGDRGDRAR